MSVVVCLLLFFVVVVLFLSHMAADFESQPFCETGKKEEKIFV